MINLEISMITHSINGLISFSEYMLSEAIKVISVQYGTNDPYFNNKKTVKTSYLDFSMDHSTIFLFNNYAYVLDMFNVKNTPSVVLRTNPVKYEGEDSSEIFRLASPSKRKHAQAMPYVHVIASFSAAVSVTLDIAIHNHYNKVKFTAYDPVLLKGFYDKLFSNKTFIKSLSDNGWSIDNKEDEYFFIKN